MDNQHLRPIRSFVIRGGRMTTSQQKAFDRLWPEKGLAVENGLLDLESAFGRRSTVVLEIGFGMGQSLAEMAANEPDADFIGVEVHKPGVGALLRHMEEQSLENIRIFWDDANEVIDKCLPDASLDRVQLFFPDPWHKKRHNKRRIVQLEFVQRIRAKLKNGGVFHMATDWEPYAEHMMEIMSEAPGMENIAGAGQFSPRPDTRPVTKFEKRGERLGHGVWDLMFRRVD
ncbi:tRNA (guanosine(46)-N7)-methyltransferase TrmB [Hahella aquimaris]|uniref:tRNA (guanosine(46)-N7)-methyltransferase TrmB n=1 Tax=Hahella sp. HNIBRBA332 TaxID=3015983 RepID=UPI00273A761E|nr:tRNA (guanosine(46)-N7)-methyltransferase TrmB [Hahella sp. HNIBRBA332]WLQ13675.1 tRNA (guanosine(46)-N7)-methyltransferase TrmB [Hahella sp. HNIBRBA332]